MKHYFFVVQHNNEIYENWYFMNIDETSYCKPTFILCNLFLKLITGVRQLNFETKPVSY